MRERESERREKRNGVKEERLGKSTRGRWVLGQAGGEPGWGVSPMKSTQWQRANEATSVPRRLSTWWLLK